MFFWRKALFLVQILGMFCANTIFFLRAVTFLVIFLFLLSVAIFAAFAINRNSDLLYSMSNVKLLATDYYNSLPNSEKYKN